MKISPHAGKPVAPELLENVPNLLQPTILISLILMVPRSWDWIHMETII
jgi:hypothetical protein